MDEMKETMACDEATFSTIVHGCAQTRDWLAAERLLEEMRDAGFTPNDACYYALISAASKAGELPLAEKLLKAMKQDGVPPDLYAFASVVTGCGAYGEWRMAMRLLELMEAEGLLPTRKIYSGALRACRGGEAEVAAVLMEKMRRQGVDRDVFGCAAAIEAFGRGGRADKALALMEDLRRDGPLPNRELSLLFYFFFRQWCCP